MIKSGTKRGGEVVQRKTFPISKVFVSIKTSSDENHFDSIHFGEKLNLKAFVKVQRED